jgi:hypothetical protein
MAIEDKCDVPGDYKTRLAALLKTEAEMGETSALISEMADALSHSAANVDLIAGFLVHDQQRVSVADWPSFRDLCVAFQSWREQRVEIEAMWDRMTPDERAGIEPPPSRGGRDITRPWL